MNFNERAFIVYLTFNR